MKFYPRNIYVCGVYTDWCVEATVRGLLRKKNVDNIHVICKACYPQEFNQYKGKTNPNNSINHMCFHNFSNLKQLNAKSKASYQLIIFQNPSNFSYI
jgi:hypothetical protein